MCHDTICMGGLPFSSPAVTGLPAGLQLGRPALNLVSCCAGGVWRGRGRGGTGRQVKRGVSSRDHSAGPSLGASQPQRKRRSRYQGVSFEEATSTWVAALRHHGKVRHRQHHRQEGSALVLGRLAAWALCSHRH